MAAGAPPDEPPFDLEVPEEIVPPEFADFMTPEGAVGAGMLEKQSGIPLSQPGFRGRMPGTNPSAAPQFNIAAPGPNDADATAALNANYKAGRQTKSPEQRTADVLLNREPKKSPAHLPGAQLLRATGHGDSEIMRALNEGHLEWSAYKRANPTELATPDDWKMLGQIGFAVGTGIVTAPYALPIRMAAQAGVGGALAGQQGEGPGGIARAAAIGAIAEPLAPLLGTGLGLLRQGAGKVLESVRKWGGLPARVGYGSVSAPLRPFIAEGTEAAVQTADELGVVLTPGKVTENTFVQLAEGVARSPISLTSGKMGRIDRATDVAARDAFNNTLNQLPNPSREQLMGTVHNIVDGHTREVKGVAQGYLNQADAIIGSPAVDARPFKVALNSIIPEGEPIPGEVSATIRALANLPDTITYKRAGQIRSLLFDLEGQPTALQPAAITREARHARMLYDSIDKQIDAGIAGAPAAALKMLEDGRTLWREEVKGTLSQRFIARIASTQPEDMLDTLLVRNNVGDLRRINDVIDAAKNSADPALAAQAASAQDNLRGAYLRRLFERSGEGVVQPDGSIVTQLNGEQFVESLKKAAGYDDAFFKEMFPGQSREIVKDLTLYANLQAKNAGTLGGPKSIAFQFAQSAAIGGVAMAVSGGDWATALGSGGTAIVLTPTALQYVITNPKVRKWLTVGAGAKPGSSVAARATIMVLGNLLADNMLDKENTAVAQRLVKDSQVRIDQDPTGATSRPNLRLPDASFGRQPSITTVDALKDAVHRKTGGQ